MNSCNTHQHLADLSAIQYPWFTTLWING